MPGGEHNRDDTIWNDVSRVMAKFSFDPVVVGRGQGWPGPVDGAVRARAPSRAIADEFTPIPPQSYNSIKSHPHQMIISFPISSYRENRTRQFSRSLWGKKHQSFTTPSPRAGSHVATLTRNLTCRHFWAISISFKPVNPPLYLFITR